MSPYQLTDVTDLYIENVFIFGMSDYDEMYRIFGRLVLALPDKRIALIEDGEIIKEHNLS